MQEETIERLFGEMATDASGDVKAPSRLKSRIYSALMRQQEASGPLLSLSDTRAAGRGLCVFESLTNLTPTGEALKRLNLCQVCHARVLAEHVEGAPIFWHNCPYVKFQSR